MNLIYSFLQEDQKFSLSSHPSASFFAKSQMDTSLRSSTSSRVTHLNFLPTEDSKNLVVGVGDNSNSHVELWMLNNQSISLHRLYQVSINQGGMIKVTVL